MDTTLSDSTPLEVDYGNKICFNRFLEEEMSNGLVSNCLQCHKRAVYVPQNQANKTQCGYDIALKNRCTETTQGPLQKCDSKPPDSCNQPVEDYYNGALKTDFLWTISEAQKEDARAIQNAFVDLLMQQ